MKVTLDQIEGVIVKDNETYVLEDNNFLEHLTLSRTYLKPGKSTRGHSHENQEEVYIFTHGNGIMTIGEEKFVAKSGDTFLIPKGHFHRVENASDSESCAFTCIFEKYDRLGDEAIY
jgi:mannose-6-phosphate isomerase-like protein (cupin superfamily)